MPGRTGVGAAVGLWAGLAVVAWLVLLPRWRQGSFYEVGDPLLVMGVPVLVLATAVGAGVGSSLEPSDGGDAHPRWVTIGGPALGVTGLVVAALLLLWGTGIIGTPR